MKFEGPLLRSQLPVLDRFLSQPNPVRNLISRLLKIHSPLCTICHLAVGVFCWVFPIKIWYAVFLYLTSRSYGLTEKTVVPARAEPPLVTIRWNMNRVIIFITIT
jgi:hypothetical protein